MTKKIIHISTSIHGGAGIAALRSHQSLLKQGYLSELYVREKNSNHLEQVKQIYIPILLKLCSKLITLIQKIVIQRDLKLVTPYSLNLLKFDKKLKRKIEDADIVHIHSFYNILSVKAIIKLAKKRVIFLTLHDERFITGGCHYTCNCEEFRKFCRNCPQVNSLFRPIIENSQRSKKLQLKGSSKLKIVTPSNWLANQIKKSGITSIADIRVIMNSIQNVDESSREQKNCELRIGFISTSLNNPYKGFNFLVSAINQLFESDHEFDFTLILVGKGQRERLNPNIKVEHYQDLDYREMYKKINIDVLLVVSEFDNFPNVLGEAVINGVPLIGTKVGGIQELAEKFNFPCVDYGDCNSLVNEIRKFKKLTKYDRNTLMKQAKDYFDLDVHANSLTKYYSI